MCSLSLPPEGCISWTGSSLLPHWHSSDSAIGSTNGTVHLLVHIHKHTDEVNRSCFEHWGHTTANHTTAGTYLYDFHNHHPVWCRKVHLVRQLATLSHCISHNRHHLLLDYTRVVTALNCNSKLHTNISTAHGTLGPDEWQCAHMHTREGSRPSLLQRQGHETPSELLERVSWCHPGRLGTPGPQEESEHKTCRASVNTHIMR